MPHDVTQLITAHSTHFFPPDAKIPVYITVYKTGSATVEDVAGYLMFTEQPLSGDFRDRLHSEHQAIVKHFGLAQFAAVQQLLIHRLDHVRQGLSLHYVGEEIVGGWTTLDAGASPGLDLELLPLVKSPTRRAVTAEVAVVKRPIDKKKTPKKK